MNRPSELPAAEFAAIGTSKDSAGSDNYESLRKLWLVVALSLDGSRAQLEKACGSALPCKIAVRTPRLWYG